VETRVLLRQQNEWTGYSYAWNDTHTDAMLTPKEGSTRDGWRFPGRNECALCHSREANFVLGLSTVQLNRKGAGGENQLTKWEREGVIAFNHATAEEAEWKEELGAQKLSDAAFQAKLDLVLRTDIQREPAKLSPLLAHAAKSYSRLTDPRDASASVHDRARAYLHANCSHCHVHNGGGNSALQLGIQIADEAMELISAVPMHTTFGIPDAKLAAPGEPHKSMLIYRPSVRGPGQMPPVGTKKADGEGVALLAKWISGLSAAAPHRSVQKP
jgi:mono/diheme cytochrome c family protein